MSLRRPWDIDADEVGVLARRLVRCRSSNPPGDVTEVAQVVRDYLDRYGLKYRIHRPASDRLNLVCTVDSGASGRRIVLSGHLDTFPEAPDQRRRAPLGNGGVPAVYGRGIADMKGGVAGALVLLKEFAQVPRDWQGSVSAVLVCDEESFGPHGARRLLDSSLLDVDAVLTAEPSGRARIRYGERGPIWGTVEFRGPGGHAGYSHGGGPNPIERAGAFATTLRECFGRAFGGADPRPDDPGTSVTVSTVHGGSKVNTHPAYCAIQVDIRVPLGVAAAQVVGWMTELAAEHGGSYRADVAEDANASDPDDPVFAAMSQAVRAETGVDPLLEVARGSTDGRLWRRNRVPVAQYGADPLMQATADEHVTVYELGEIARIHARTAWTLLTNTR